MPRLWCGCNIYLVEWEWDVSVWNAFQRLKRKCQYCQNFTSFPGRWHFDIFVAHCDKNVDIMLIFSFWWIYSFTHCICILFCWDLTWEHVSWHWQKSKCQLWATCFMGWRPIMNSECLTTRDTRSSPKAVPSMLATRPFLNVKNGFAPAERHNTSSSQ